MVFSTFIHYVFETDPLLFSTYVFWACVGVLLSLLFNANRRTVSNKTQVAFCWKFLWINNYKRILISFILVLVTIRFSTQLIGLKQSAFSSFIVGFCSDRLGKILQLKIKNLIG